MALADAPPREQILDVAARLFVRKGVAGTATREIADGVGIRQASLYYHFENKEQILGELLQRSIRPTVDKVAKLELLTPPEGTVNPDTVLYALAMLDVKTLAAVPHNAGVLTRLPEVQRLDVFADFGLARDDLASAYARLAAKVESLLDVDMAAATRRLRPVGCVDLGTLLIQLVEVVISVRASGQPIADDMAANIAGACLRVCGASSQRVAAAAAAAADVIATIGE